MMPAFVPKTMCVHVGALCAALLLLTGCQISAFGEQPPTRLYVLSTLEDQAKAASVTAATSPRIATNDLTIGVSTIAFPPYLERKEIITRASDNELIIHRFDKWGSAPDEEFARAVAANLRTLLPARTILNPPFRPEMPIDYEVRFGVTRFERIADGSVVLDSQWVIWQAREGRILSTQSSRIQIPNVADAVPQVVAAMSQAVGTLSEEVAQSLAPLPKRRGTL